MRNYTKGFQLRNPYCCYRLYFIYRKQNQNFQTPKNKDLSMQSGGAAMLGTPSAPSSPAISLGAGGDQGASRAPQGQPSSLLGLGALHEMQPTGKHASDGTDFGRGEGSNALPNSVNPDRRPIENSALIGKYLPDLINAARIEGAPDSYKRFVNKLKGMI